MKPFMSGTSKDETVNVQPATWSRKPAMAALMAQFRSRSSVAVTEDTFVKADTAHG